MRLILAISIASTNWAAVTVQNRKWQIIFQYPYREEIWNASARGFLYGAEYFALQNERVKLHHNLPPNFPQRVCKKDPDGNLSAKLAVNYCNQMVLWNLYSIELGATAPVVSRFPSYDPTATKCTAFETS